MEVFCQTDNEVEEKIPYTEYERHEIDIEHQIESLKTINPKKHHFLQEFSIAEKRLKFEQNFSLE